MSTEQPDTPAHDDDKSPAEAGKTAPARKDGGSRRPTEQTRAEKLAARMLGPNAQMLTELMNNHLDPGYSAAAEHRAEIGPPIGWRLSARQGATLVTAMLIGLVLVLAYQQAVAQAPQTETTKKGLTHEIQQRSKSTDALQRQAQQLRGQLTTDRDRQLAGDSVGANLATRVRDLDAQLGFAAVHGPGLTLTLSDGAPSNDPVTGRSRDGTDLWRVQDRDLQGVVNALWAAGAEAIAVNDQRLAPTSAIRSAGGILVDFKPVSSPYAIRVIGDTSALRDRFAVSAAARLMTELSRYGIKLTLSQQSDLTLPAATAPNLRYADQDPPKPSASPSKDDQESEDGSSGDGGSTGKDDSSPDSSGSNDTGSHSNRSRESTKDKPGNDG